MRITKVLSLVQQLGLLELVMVLSYPLSKIILPFPLLGVCFVIL